MPTFFDFDPDFDFDFRLSIGAAERLQNGKHT